MNYGLLLAGLFGGASRSVSDIRTCLFSVVPDVTLGPLPLPFVPSVVSAPCSFVVTRWDSIVFCFTNY